MRGIRGAITVEKNNREDILENTKLLLDEVISVNNVKDEEIASIVFTATDDLDQVYPAVAARQLGYDDVPLLCYQELMIQGSLDKCIRIMLYINRNCARSEIKHVYLKGAKVLRPDLVEGEEKKE